MSSRVDVAKVLLENQDGKFLTVRERESGKWELPGGKIEGSETRFEAASREVREETGKEISNWNDVVRVEVEDSETVNCWILHSRTSSSRVELNEEELSEWKWVSSGQFRDMDWHADGGYGLPPMVYLDDYLNS